MRSFKSGKFEVAIRPLKRKEIKALKKDGFDLRNIDPDKVDETMDAVFELLFGKKEVARIDELEEKVVLHRLWPEVMAETFSSPDEEKNSEEPGNSTQTPTE